MDIGKRDKNYKILVQELKKCKYKMHSDYRRVKQNAEYNALLEIILSKYADYLGNVKSEKEKLGSHLADLEKYLGDLLLEDRENPHLINTELRDIQTKRGKVDIDLIKLSQMSGDNSELSL